MLLSPKVRFQPASAFFGASPVVASALGIRSGATPRGRIHSKPHPSALPRKEDISTLLGIGHFYFALTIFSSFPSRATPAEEGGPVSPRPGTEGQEAPHS